MKRHFGPCWPVFLLSALIAQKQTLILVPGEKGPTVGYQRAVFFELNEQYEFINSEIYSD